MLMMMLFSALLLGLTVPWTFAFVGIAPMQPSLQQQSFSPKSCSPPLRQRRDDLHRQEQTAATTAVMKPLSMCICIDCARVTNCAAYHFVESKHEQPHMTETPTFEPRDGSPTIHVNVRTQRDNEQMARLWKEHENETAKAEQLAADSGAVEGALHGETVYDLSPVTTTEYDVVACADFVLDKGCWVRNMPEEIRKANPDFVPT